MPPPKTLPSQTWKSYEPWNYNGLLERLECFIPTINKSALRDHIETVMGKSAKISDPFSAGQYWCCFEFVLSDESLVIARVRLPPHPDSNEDMTAEDEEYGIQCEVATMKHIQDKVTSVPVPKVYAYEAPGSERAEAVGAGYMLIEGFYGNTSQDVEFDICNLPTKDLEHVVTQWTAVQAELATFTFPKIGSISHFDGEARIGPLGVGIAEGFQNTGPFDTSQEYFVALADARYTAAVKETSPSSSENTNFALLGAISAT